MDNHNDLRSLLDLLLTGASNSSSRSCITSGGINNNSRNNRIQTGYKDQPQSQQASKQERKRMFVFVKILLHCIAKSGNRMLHMQVKTAISSCVKQYRRNRNGPTKQSIPLSQSLNDTLLKHLVGGEQSIYWIRAKKLLPYYMEHHHRRQKKKLKNNIKSTANSRKIRYGEGGEGQDETFSKRQQQQQQVVSMQLPAPPLLPPSPPPTPVQQGHPQHIDLLQQQQQQQQQLQQQQILSEQLQQLLLLQLQQDMLLARMK